MSDSVMVLPDPALTGSLVGTIAVVDSGPTPGTARPSEQTADATTHDATTVTITAFDATGRETGRTSHDVPVGTATTLALTDIGWPRAALLVIDGGAVAASFVAADGLTDATLVASLSATPVLASRGGVVVVPAVVG
jgi:hypothetical protein